MAGCIRAWLLTVVIATAASLGSCCVYLEGSSPFVEELSAGKPVAGHFDYAFHGQNWVGFDSYNKSWACLTGKQQTPINVPTYFQSRAFDDGVSQEDATVFQYGTFTSNGSDIQILNNGHTIQVQFNSARMPQIQVKVPVGATVLTDALKLKPGQDYRIVNATALQFHFHTTSEHYLEGHAFPLEMHIVHVVPPSQLPGCVPANGYMLGGCLTVLGVMIKLSSRDNPELAKLWPLMPLREKPLPGYMVNLPAGFSVNIDALLPKSKSYVSYPGSLTTPPCYEGLLWHVMTNPISLSEEQWMAFKVATGSWQCTEHGEPIDAAMEESIKFADANYDSHKFYENWEEELAAEAKRKQLRRRLHDITFAPEEKVQSDDNYTCVKIAMANNFRWVQPLGKRKLRYYKDK